MTTKPSKAPAHLQPSTRAWWADVCRDYELEAHHVRLLTLAAEAWDRAQSARTTVEKDGAFYVNRFGEPRVHPGVGVERDSRIAFARLLRELALDVAAPPDPRPPRAGVRHAA